VRQPPKTTRLLTNAVHRRCLGGETAGGGGSIHLKRRGTALLYTIVLGLGCAALKADIRGRLSKGDARRDRLTRGCALHKANGACVRSDMQLGCRRRDGGKERGMTRGSSHSWLPIFG